MIVMSGGFSYAGDYPERPVTSVVPWSPGGSTDSAARILSSIIIKYLGQPFVTINKPGVIGTTGGSFVAKSEPDGYTVGHFTTPAILPEFFPKFFKTDYASQDMVPVAQWSSYPPTLICKSDADFKDFKSFIVYAKKNNVSIATQGRGLVPVALQIVQRMEDIPEKQISYVPYKGDSKIVAAVLGGHVQAGTCSFGTAAPLIKAGKIRALSIIVDTKIDEFPDVPNLYSLGYKTGIKDFVCATYAPADTPKERLFVLQEAIKKTCEDKAFIATMKKLNMPVIYKPGDEVFKVTEEIKMTIKDLVEKGFM